MLWHAGKQVEAVAYVRNSGVVTIEYKEGGEKIDVPWDDLVHDNGLPEVAKILRRVRQKGELRG